MDGRRGFSWLIILLLIISLNNLGWVLGNSHGKQSGERRKLMSGNGFLSLDCGIPRDSSYTIDETGIDYISDAIYIDTGTIYNISQQYIEENTEPFFNSVRSFPDGKRNCYTLPAREGNKYLIRARFRYGNYDGKNQLPIFKLYLGVGEWDTVNISDVSRRFRHEIVHIPLTDQIDVCLVNTDTGTPFISVLELRQLSNSIYSPSEPGSLLLFNRWDLGHPQQNKSFREKDDVYDRMWLSWARVDLISIHSSLVSSSLSASDYKVPANVMATAITPVNESAISMEFEVDIEDDPSQKLYIYMHFAEVQDILDQTREFTISANNHTTFGGPLTPRQDTSETRYNKYSISGSTTSKLTISLKRTIRSSLPPLINAVEIYNLKDLSLASTQQNDVVSMKHIKSEYGVSRNWQGDPCLPTDYQWDGLTCSHNTSAPAIISLNLSSSNLSGDIFPSFSGLKSLQSLDLSYNNLTGQVPKFFADLPSLIALNLTGNNLTGLVPRAVLRKFKNGILRLGENPNLCQLESCQGTEEKKTNSLIPILVPILSVIVIMIVAAALAMIIRKCKRKGTEAMETAIEYRKDGQLNSGNCVFSYFEIRSITDDFSQIIGRGGFGQVYLGTLADGTQVAVKVRSKLSVQGPKELQAEAKLLMRVHHKNLVRLVGYCDDGSNMALIYEYMSNGNLQQKLSGGDTIVLSWKQRLQIAVDASQGLEYLHNGCKPAIVHRDMKSSNILLNETLQAKISDFGMSRDVATESGAPTSTVLVGTLGYLDPQYQSTGILNKKSDVYSFGIVLLELITGQPAIKKPGGIHIVGWVTPMIERGDIRSIMDPKLQGDFNTNSAWKALETALACVASVGMERPDMSPVVVELKECLEMEMASKRITVDTHTITSGNLLDDSPLVLGNELAPHAR